MRRKQKARSDVGASEQARQEALDRALPAKYLTANTADGQGISRFLLHGEKNAISAADLAKIAGCDRTRELRELILREQRRGFIILSSENGYYLPSEDEAQMIYELRKFEHRCDSRLKSNRIAVRPVKRLLKQLRREELDGQELIEGMEGNKWRI